MAAAHSCTVVQCSASSLAHAELRFCPARHTLPFVSGQHYFSRSLLGNGDANKVFFTRTSTQGPKKAGFLIQRSFTSVTGSRSCNRAFGSKQEVQNARPSLRVAGQVQRRCIIKCQAAAEEPTVDNSTVLVVGGGGIGLETFKALPSAGSWVIVYQRSDKFCKDIKSLGAMLAIGDVLDLAVIEKTFKSNTFDAVVVIVGGGTVQPEVDKSGPINFIDAAKKAGVKRFIMVSSIGASDSRCAIDDKTYGVLEKVLIAKEAVEDNLRASGLEYTIIRPGGLLSGAPPSGKGVLTEDPTIAGLISRTDVATLISSNCGLMLGIPLLMVQKFFQEDQQRILRL